MINVMRKHHKVLMIIITALVCISFSWYWNANKVDYRAVGSGVVGKIYDRNVSQAEFQRNARLLRLTSELGLQDLAQGLTLGAQSEDEAFENFSWNLMVLRHEADEFGIKPSKEDIAEMEKTLPAFQGENGFDYAKYTDFVDHALGPLGFSDAQVDELASDQIALERLQKLLGTGIAVSDSEMRESFEQLYSKMNVSVVHFRSADFANEVKLSDQDIAKYYETHKTQLKTDEKRQVKFVVFGLTDEQKKLTGRARIDVLQKMADRANDFTEALQAKDANFDALAAKFQVTPQQTGEFSQAQPDPLLNATPQLTQSAFSLTTAGPNSEAVQGTDGFFVEHLIKIDPSRPLTLEEAQPKIVKALTEERTQSSLAAKAASAAQQLRDAMKNGKSADEAAAQTGLTLEKIPPFALLENPPGAPASSPPPKNDSPDLTYIRGTVAEMKPGAVSDLVKNSDGGLLVILEKREPLDAAAFNAARPSMESRALRGQNQVVFYEWLRERRRAAGIEEKKRLPAAG